MQGLYEIYLSVALELLKEMDLLLDPPLPQDCDNLRRHNFNDYVISDTHSNP